MRKLGDQLPVTLIVFRYLDPSALCFVSEQDSDLVVAKAIFLVRIDVRNLLPLQLR
jgi:hypothetical protein